ncbi:hypothetical protein [Hydrogenophaga sp. PML113]|uniref:hypothetical protein n=1 Tax=Hydrogenophaga sp. PML113 TaxID=1899350 RepID=UPI001586AE8F|nr:hypothetical protein [Hydrogenophaga sp. PML113]
MLSLFSFVWFVLFVAAAVVAYDQFERADEAVQIAFLRVSRSVTCEAPDGPATGH